MGKGRLLSGGNLVKLKGDKVLKSVILKFAMKYDVATMYSWPGKEWDDWWWLRPISWA